MLRTKQFNIFVDNEFARWCSDHNMTWNDSNFFMSNDVTTLSNCCRLLSDTSKLSGFINSIGGTALSIGSIKVNTINLVHIVYEILDGEQELTDSEYLKILRKRTKLCCKVLDRIRHIISRNVEKGLLPNYGDGGIEIDKQYCTIGILGLYELMDKFGYMHKLVIGEDERVAVEQIDTACIGSLTGNLHKVLDDFIFRRSGKLSCAVHCAEGTVVVRTADSHLQQGCVSL